MYDIVRKAKQFFKLNGIVSQINSKPEVFNLGILLCFPLFLEGKCLTFKLIPQVLLEEGW